ncbi:MAG: hypothetical protein ACYYK0_04980 [Candidatus Eutrophobiaceae bacterium]
MLKLIGGSLFDLSMSSERRRLGKNAAETQRRRENNAEAIDEAV